MRQFSGVDATFLHKENARTTDHVSGVVVLGPSTVTDTAPASVYAMLVKPRDGRRLCRNCVAKSRAGRCARCGTVKEAAARDEHGQLLCPNCLIADPANQESSLDCGRRRPVSVRTPDGPLCANCVPCKILTCGICERCPLCDLRSHGRTMVPILQATLDPMLRLR